MYHYIKYFNDNDFSITQEHDDLIRQLLVKYKNNKPMLVTCRIKSTWLKNHNVYNYLINRYNNVSDIQEIVYLIYYNYIEKPEYIQCPVCKKQFKAKFRGFINGYNKYCSYKCAINDLTQINNSHQKTDITDQDILEHLIDDKGNLISTYISKRHLMSVGYYDYLMNRYTDNSTNTIQEIVYRIKYNINIAPICLVCGKHVKFIRFHEGYRKYCSPKCKTSSEQWKDIVQAKRITLYDNKWAEKGIQLEHDKHDKNTYIVYNQCNKHPKFHIKKTMLYNRFNTNIQLCPICNPERNPNTSIEQILENILIDLNINYQKHIRTIIKPKELDFYIPEFNLAIECNGMFWHSGSKGKKLAQLKYQMCNDKHIQLLTFWEDDIRYKQTQIINILKNKCLLNTNIINDNCQIQTITNYTAKQFINQYDICEYKKSFIKLGLFHDNQLLQVMTFNRQGKQYKLNQFCTKQNYSINNGYKMLLKYAVDNYKIKEIVTCIDNEMCNERLIEDLGFIFVEQTKPTYMLYNRKVSDKRIKHKQNGLKYIKCYNAGYKKYKLKL